MTEANVERRIESYTQEFDGDDLARIRVVGAWEREPSQLNDYEGENVTVETLWSVDGDIVELNGFYPKGTVTGDELYRETLRSLRVLYFIWREVFDRVGDHYSVVQPDETVADEYNL